MSEPIDELLPAVPDVQILRLRPGDTLVYRSLDRVSDEEYANIAARLKKCFPDNLAILLENGAEITVLRAEDGERP